MKFAGLTCLFCILFAMQANALVRAVALYEPAGMTDSLFHADTLSMHHSLDIAGVPWVRCSDIESACQNAMVIYPSKFTNLPLTSAQLDSFTSYVTAGGVLVGFWVRTPNALPLFGISGTVYGTKRYRISWDTESNDPSLQWINDPHEKVIRLGDSTKANIFGTVGLTPAPEATALAYFDDGSAAVVRRRAGAGFAYSLGVVPRDLIAMNQLHWGYAAALAYSNDFEPTSDVFMLFFRGLYQKHIPYAVWKHSSPGFSGASLLITHDVDSRSGTDTMRAFAEMEQRHGVKAHYFVTTHHFDDPPRMSSFYNANAVATCREIRAMGHGFGSHSVAHPPDFAASSFPIGTPGNTRESYRPLCASDSTRNGSIYGELEVSRNILEEDLGISVRSFRSGHLAHPRALPEILQQTGYSFNSSRSACDMLTNFPYYPQEGTTLSGLRSSVLEIPMAISDVLEEGSFDTASSPVTVNMWKDVLTRNAANGAPTVLLIHPNRMQKVAAEEQLLNALPAGIAVMDFGDFGAFWNDRTTTTFTTVAQGDSLLVIQLLEGNMTRSNGSFALDSVPGGNRITVIDSNGTPLETRQTQWGTKTLVSFGSASAIHDQRPLPKSAGRFAVRARRILFRISLPRETNISFRLYNTAGATVYAFTGSQPSGECVLTGPRLPAGIFVADVVYSGMRLQKRIANF